MAIQTKPTDINKVWAQTGAKIKPSDSKISEGYVAEIPTHQNFNWLMGMFSEFCQHVNQSGIPLWDATTNYFTNSIVKGSNGLIYISKTDNNSNHDPAADNGTNWTASSITPAVGFSASLVAPLNLPNATPTNVVFDNVLENRGGHYSAGVFTAPFNGVYLVCISGQAIELSSGLSLVMNVTDGTNSVLIADNDTPNTSSGTSAISCNSKPVPLQAGQQIHTIVSQVSNTPATVKLIASIPTCFFSCHLLYRT